MKKTRTTRTAAGVVAAAALTTGLVLAGGGPAAAAPLCVSPAQLEQSLKEAVALERSAEPGELAPTTVGRY
ncbi:hypothetical protein [Streptomyces sp. SGAir0957]